MMATFDDVAERLTQDKAFRGAFLADPKTALEKAGLKVQSGADIKRLELFSRASLESLTAAGRLVGIGHRLEAQDWGIGAGCCSSALLLPGATITDPVEG